MRAAFIVWVFLVSTFSAEAQWAEKGPSGGSVRQVVTKGTTIFAASNGGGVFRSTDGGTHWMAANNGMSSRSILCIAYNNNYVFAGTQGAGVFRSPDNGDNWEQVITGLNSPFVLSLCVSGNAIYAGTIGSGVFRSTNNGGIWTAVNTGLTDQVVNSMTLKGNVLFAGTNAGIFTNTNNSDAWVAAGLSAEIIQFISAFGSKIYTGTYHGLYYSETDGAAWSLDNAGLGNQTVTCMIEGAGKRFAGTAGAGIFIYNEVNSTWGATSLTDKSMTSFVVSGSFILGSCNDGIVRSQDAGGNWAGANVGLNNQQVEDMVEFGDFLFAATFEGVFRSDNNGESWTAKNSGIGTGIVFDLTSFDGVIYAATAFGPVKSVNMGDAWVQFDGGQLAGASSLAVGTIGTFGGTGVGVYRLNADGAHWTEVNNGLTNTQIATLLIVGDKLYAGTAGGGIFVSSNSGDSWSAVNDGLASLYVNTLSTHGTELVAGTYGGVFHSNNGGTSWSPAGSLGLVRSISFYEDQILAGTDQGIFIANANFNWAPFSTGLTNRNVYAMYSGNDVFLAGTGSNSIFGRPSVSVEEMSPIEGPVETTVTIRGGVFSETNAENEVRFNGASAVVASASTTMLTVIVPGDATTGPVTVAVGDKPPVNAGTFGVLPIIAGFSPAFGAVGDAVTITGYSFSEEQSDNTVEFNGVVAEVTTASTTSLTAIVPPGASTGFISVTVAGHRTTSSNPFTVMLTTGVADREVQSVYPNPFSNYLKVVNEDDSQFDLLDARGIVLCRDFSSTSPLDTSVMAEGIYFVKITAREGVRVVKVLKVGD